MARSKKLDLNRMLQKYDIKASKVLQKVAYNAAVKKSDKIKKQALDELNNHIVTKEIEDGPSAKGSSLLGGVGSLFAFLGFPSNSKPVVILRDALTKYIRVQKGKGIVKKVQKTRFTIEFPIEIPTIEEIYNVTPLAWTTKSWVKGVEKGITNYTNTVFKDSDGSRSGGAFQSKQKIGFAKFSPTPYIIPILNKLKKELK
jgi:hypothetical protein